MTQEVEMRWGRKADESIASNEIDDERIARSDDFEGGGAHVDTTRVDDADRYTAEDGEDVDRATVVDREREALGGVKVGSAFFGWLAATGMAVLLTALVAAGGAAVSLAQGNEADAPVDTIGVTEAIVLGDLEMPPDCTLVAIVRDRHVIAPASDTQLSVGDEVLALATPEAESDLREVLAGDGE